MKGNIWGQWNRWQLKWLWLRQQDLLSRFFDVDKYSVQASSEFHRAQSTISISTTINVAKMCRKASKNANEKEIIWKGHMVNSKPDDIIQVKHSMCVYSVRMAEIARHFQHQN